MTVQGVLMSYEYYIFAAFVFLLLLAVLYLNHMFKKSRSEGDTRDDRDRKLYVLYQNLEEEMLAFDDDRKRACEESDEKLKRMEELLEKMEQMSVAMQLRLEKARADFSALPEKADAAKAEPQKREPKRDDRRVPRKRSPKTEQVRQMHEEGMDAEEIARSLAISRGEVELILGIGK